MLRLLIIASLILTSACSTVMEGSSQKISVNSIPSGAECTLRSNDEIIARVNSTPETLTVSKSKYDIIVECEKQGYQKGKAKNHSDYAISSIGNMVFGQFGVVGNLFDSATGAGNKYDSQVFVELEKLPQIQQMPQTITQSQYQPIAQPAKSPIFVYNQSQQISEPVKPAMQVAMVSEVSSSIMADKQAPFDIAH